jgi:hypothetical protein
MVIGGMCMASLIDRLWSTCFTPKRDYSALQKKDDSLGDQVHEWVRLYPNQESLNNFEAEKARKYASQLIASLKNFPITSSNASTVKKHLIDICEKNKFISKYVIDHFGELIGDEKALESIELSLLTIC